MYNRTLYKSIVLLSICLGYASCSIPKIAQREPKIAVPQMYTDVSDTTNITSVQWRKFFTDQNLISLIDTALKNNQELLITLQEIEMAQNDIKLRHSKLLPTVGARVGAGVEKVGRYTSQGAGDATTEIKPGEETPDPLTDFSANLYASWEVDIWKKLRNAKKAAVIRYLSTVEGKNFVLTNLVAEVASSYYELMALNNQLAVVRQNIELQKNALEIVKVQKTASRVTELAVQKFRAEVLKTQSLEFDITQDIKETENRLNLLLGRYPQPIVMDQTDFLSLSPSKVNSGIPSQLMSSRPDIKQAELELAAAKLDVKVARAEFYPSFDITATLGLQSFKPAYLVTLPASLIYSFVGDMAAPLINRAAIKAEFRNANARQLQAMYNYERVVLNAYLEVSNQLSGVTNLQKSYDLKRQQVDALTQSIDISNDLFKSARADYLEVLMTQRDALEAKLELIETKQKQLNAVTTVYRDLGGGWAE